MDASSLTRKCGRLLRLLIGPRNAGWLGVTPLSEVGQPYLGVGGKDPGKFGHRDDSEQQF
jgi:hypothetical protein